MKNCTKGYSCGESCISVNFKCKDTLATEAFSTLAKVYFNEAESKALMATLETKGVSDRYEATKSKYPQLSDNEALGLANWVGPNYRYINRHLLGLEKPDSEPKLWAKPAAKAINSALAKLPTVTESSLDELANMVPDQETAKAKISQFKASKAEYKLTRGIKINDPEAFFKSNNIAKGKTMETDHLFATSFDPDLSTFAGNITYKLKPNSDGMSKGKAIDAIKAKRFESEILYPVGAKFTVDNIEQSLPKLDAKLASKFKAAKAKQALEDLAKSLNAGSVDEVLNAVMPDFSNLSKADAKKMEKLFEQYTNFAYIVYLTEQ